MKTDIGSPDVWGVQGPTKVKATREGLVGQLTSSGYRIDKIVSFVALPNTATLHHTVQVTNPLNGNSIYAQVLDVGPWNIDDPYVGNFNLRPLAEQNIKTDGKGNRISGPTNGAGIDLGEYVWNYLGMLDNGLVEWQFVD